jgi:hypothetical protein
MPRVGYRKFPTPQHKTLMTSVQAGVTFFGQQNCMSCWPILHTFIRSMSCLDNSVSCLEIKLVRSNASILETR